MSETPEKLIADFLAQRIARLCRGLWILVGVGAALAVVVTIVGWIQDAELRVHGYAGTFDGLGGGVVLIGFSFLTGWFYVWVFSGRYARLAREGKPVVAKTVGEITAWGSEFLDAGKWIAPIREANGRLETIAQGKIDWEDLVGQLIFSANQMGKAQFLRDLSRNSLRGQIESATRHRANSVNALTSPWQSPTALAKRCLVGIPRPPVRELVRPRSWLRMEWRG